MSKLNKIIKSTVLFWGTTFFVASLIISYKEASSLPIYKNNSFPFSLSAEAKVAIPKCIAIYNSLENEIAYNKRYQKLSQLDTCLEKTPLYPTYKNRVVKTKNYFYLAVHRPETLDIKKLNGDYSIFLRDLGDLSRGIPALQYYRMNFATELLIRILIFSILSAVMILIGFLITIEFEYLTNSI